MTRELLEAAVFDLDGVLTRTAGVHFGSWRALFDEFLRDRVERAGEGHRPFSQEDFLAYVDGKPRLDGVRAFIASRGIRIQEGDPADPPGTPTVHGLGRKKDLLFRVLLEQSGVEAEPGALELLGALRAAGVRLGVATSSRNAAVVLRRAGLDRRFDALVDGIVSAELGLPGKPDPAIFLECARRLGASSPARALVVEDAAAGVRAGRDGGFGLVVGIDQGQNWLRLREAGAHLIARNLGELSPERIARFLAGRRHLRPNALCEWPDLAARLRGRDLIVFLAAPAAAAGRDEAPRATGVEDAGACGLPIYLGAEPADEPGLAAVSERGLGILVSDLPRPTAARYSLQNRFEVALFLERLARLPCEDAR